MGTNAEFGINGDFISTLDTLIDAGHFDAFCTLLKSPTEKIFKKAEEAKQDLRQLYEEATRWKIFQKVTKGGVDIELEGLCAEFGSSRLTIDVDGGGRKGFSVYSIGNNSSPYLPRLVEDMQETRYQVTSKIEQDISSFFETLDVKLLTKTTRGGIYELQHKLHDTLKLVDSHSKEIMKQFGREYLEYLRLMHSYSTKLQEITQRMREMPRGLKADREGWLKKMNALFKEFCDIATNYYKNSQSKLYELSQLKEKRIEYFESLKNIPRLKPYFSKMKHYRVDMMPKPHLKIEHITHDIYKISIEELEAKTLRIDEIEISPSYGSRESSGFMLQRSTALNSEQVEKLSKGDITRNGMTFKDCKRLDNGSMEFTFSLNQPYTSEMNNIRVSVVIANPYTGATIKIYENIQK